MSHASGTGAVTVGRGGCQQRVDACGKVSSMLAVPGDESVLPGASDAPGRRVRSFVLHFQLLKPLPDAVLSRL